MLSVVSIVEVVDEAEALCASREFQLLREFIMDLPVADLDADATLRFLLAYAHYMTGAETVAYNQLVVLHEEHSNDSSSRLYRRIVNLRAVVEIELGALAHASDLLIKVQSAAEMAGDYRYVAYATLNRGIIDDIQGESNNAIAVFQRARIAFQRMGDAAGVAACEHNLGMSYRRLRQYERAERQFASALEYYAQHGSVEELLASNLERALVLGLRGERSLGSSAGRYALRRAQEEGNNRLVAEASRVVGVIALADGDLTVARELLLKALQGGRSGQVKLLQAEALIDLAEVEAASGHTAAAGLLFGEAADVYEAMGASARATELRTRLS